MTSAKKLGFKKGDFVFTGTFPGIIIGDVHTWTPTCEVWGFEHECGSVYAHELKRLTREEFMAMAKGLGYETISPRTDEAKKALKGV